MLRARRALMTVGIPTAGLLVVTGVALVAGASMVTVSPGAADGTGSGSVASPYPVPSVRQVVLPTGQRVRAVNSGGRTVLSVDPKQSAGKAAAPTRFQVRSVPGHEYVIPEAALPSITSQTELARFDVAPIAASSAESGAASGTPGRASAPVQPAYQMATLTVRGIDTNGAASPAGSVAVDNVDDLARFSAMQSYGQTGQVSFSVPVGHYSIAAEVTTLDSDGNVGAESLVFLPEIEVTEPATTIDVDARTATVPIPIPTTPKGSSFEQLSATYGRASDNGLISTISYIVAGGQPKLYVTPTSPVSLGKVHWYTYFRLNGPSDQAQPYLYDLLFESDGAVPRQFPSAANADSLATVTVDYHSDVAGHAIGTYRASSQPWEIAPIRFASQAVAPMRRTEYVSAVSDTRWASAVVWDPTENVGIDTGPWTVFAAGDQRSERSLAAPLVPSVESGTVGTMACGACRQGDELWLNVTPWASGGRTVGGLTSTDTLTASSPTRLTADGETIAETDSPSGTFPLPSRAATLRLEVQATKRASWTTTSTTSTTAWSWRSQPREGTLPEGRVCKDSTRACSFEPLLFLAYDAGVNLANDVAAGRPLHIAVTATRQPLETTDPADTLTFEVSSDDGATWTPAEVTPGGNGAFTATLTPGTGDSYLSFRVHASDPSGNTVDQTVVRAVKVSN